ncbi:sporulation histidine kinase inhibitor Sda [Peribacillus simplex]
MKKLNDQLLIDSYLKAIKLDLEKNKSKELQFQAYTN